MKVCISNAYSSRLRQRMRKTNKSLLLSSELRQRQRETEKNMDQINILVTDDEREIADLLEIYLVSDGYRVWKA